MNEEQFKLKELTNRLSRFNQLENKAAPSKKTTATNIVIDILAAILVGLMVGWFIDSKFNTKPLAIIFCMIISFLASIKRLVNLK